MNFSVFLFVICLIVFIDAQQHQFGHHLKQLFLMRENYTNLNHGSFGSIPRSVFDFQHQIQRHVELNPDEFYRYEVYSAMDNVRAKIAAMVNADSEDIVFIPNASTATNAVLRSIRIAKPKTVLYLNTAYRMTQNTLQFMKRFYGEQLIEANLTYPVSNQSILDLITYNLQQQQQLGNDVGLTVIDHISSIPTILFDVKTIANICQSYGSLVMVDGAHALGQIPVNLTDLGNSGVTFWFGNGHKWLYSPKGSAILWVNKAYQSQIYPATISEEGQGATQFQMEFSWTGTQDYSAYLSMESALNFRQQIGGDEAIMSYIHSLAINGGNLLAKRWNTDFLIPPTMLGSMVNVRVPTQNATIANSLTQTLLDQFGTWVPVYSLGDGTNNYYVRVCAQVYNDLKDFEFLAQSVLTLVNGGAAESS